MKTREICIHEVAAEMAEIRKGCNGISAISAISARERARRLSGSGRRAGPAESQAVSGGRLFVSFAIQG